MSKIDLSRFNPEQKEAIITPSSVDILISAGAGSGKTKTLSTRVNRLIVEKEVEPSSLLVLTFTDNAAHEMKERIIASFADDEDPEVKALGEKMPSCHIQTFDSFSQYLVSTYASRLGISSSISILDEAIESSKLRELVDEIFASYYAFPERREAFVSMLKRYNCRDDRESKEVVIALYNELKKLLPSEKEAFFSSYDELYFDKGKFASWRKEYIDSYRSEVSYALMKIAYIWEWEKDDLEACNEFFAKPAFFLNPYHITTGYPFIDEPYEAVFGLLKMDDDSFLARVKDYCLNGFKKRFNYPSKQQLASFEIEDTAKTKAVYDALCALFDSQKAALLPLTHLADKATQDYEAYYEFHDDVHMIIDIAKELEERLFAYKKATNCFTFADVSSLSLRLLTEKQFEDIAETVRSRFSYIMVDEYQDTNDFQEAFLDSLLKPNKQGKRAHLFCVGDPKQAIYAFRNSNVKLFIKRQERLEGDKAAKVIHMNKNYRSGPRLLSEINYIFSFYMRKDQGEVDYLNPKEQLDYSESLYKLPYEGFGIYRIVSSDGAGDSASPLDFEIHAIIDDIKGKIASGYEVYDRDIKGLRPCRYDDFAILCRRKGGFHAFQKAFEENGIPLNIKVDTDLLDVSAVLAFQSLVCLLGAIRKGDDAALPHLFASLARSYLFAYPDEKVVDVLLSLKGDDPYAKIKGDAIYQKAYAFSLSHADSSFRQIFLDLISEFHLIDKLALIGNVNDNVEKLDSLYNLALTQEKMGEGLDEFISLFSSIRHYALSFSSESSISSSSSVDLMTIHASKGLERQIVYMPFSQNKLSKGGGSKPDCLFSKRFGLLLPRYTLSTFVPENGRQSKYSLPYLLASICEKGSDEEFSEHVRLFYVALTRAMNAIYIVGDETGKREKGSLYDMLDELPHRYQFEDEFLKRYLDEGVISPSLLCAYKTAIQTQNHMSMISESAFGEGVDATLAFERYPLYLRLRKEKLVDRVNAVLESSLEQMKDSLIEHYQGLLRLAKDPDLIASLYGKMNRPFASSSDKASYLATAKKLFGEDEKEATKRLNAFLASCLDIDKKKRDKYLHGFASFFDSCSCALRKSYANEGKFRDIVFTYAYKPFASSSSKAPSLIKIDPSHISEEEIAFPSFSKKRASKRLVTLDEDSPVREILDKGIRLHRYMELVDLRSKDTSFIKNEEDRARIDKVLSSPFFSDLSSFAIYQEYGYFDPLFLTTGSIDLLLVGEKEIRIVDYKSKHIDDPSYIDQLRAYRRNVCALFKAKPDSVKAYLLPLTGEEAQEVDLD